MKKCQYCGKSISEFALSCPFCGKKIDRQAENTIERVHKDMANSNSLISISVATVCAVVVPALWLYVTSIFGSKIIGSDWMQAIMLAGGIALKRSVVFLLAGAVILFIIRRKCKKSFSKIIIITMALSILHFICLIILEPRSEIAYEYLYPYVLACIPCVSIGCGIGSSILQGLCSLISDSNKSSKNITHICIIGITYLLVGICGSSVIFIAVRTPYGVILCAAFAAIIATVVVTFILQRIKNKKVENS